MIPDALRPLPTTRTTTRNMKLLLLCLLAATQAKARDNIIVKEFSDEFAWMDHEIPQFSNLAVDKNTGRVYIGAVNKMYQLSPDLELTKSATTGPKEDSPLCSVLPDCPSNIEKKLTNNVSLIRVGI